MLKEKNPEAALLIASPEMCQSKSYAFVGQVSIQENEDVQLVAINCRKRTDIPQKLRSILQDLDLLPTQKPLFEHLSQMKPRTEGKILKIMPHQSLAPEQLLFVGN